MRFVHYAVILLILLVGVGLFPLTVHSHPPSNMEITYDGDRQVLNITISHGVSNVDTHYIQKLELMKNDTLYLTRDYTNQPSTSTFTYTLEVAAAEGDKISVTAFCNQYGSLKKALVVNGEATGNDETDGFDFLLVSIAAVIGILLYTTKK